MMKLCTMLGAIVLATAALADEPAKTDAAAAPMKKAKVSAQQIPAADLKWTDVPEMKGISVALMWGEPETGAHGRFIKFAAGTDNPLHTHSSTLHAVVMSGTFYSGADMASAKDMGAGSYALTPSGWKHVSGCRAGADCVIYEESGGKFDFKPVGAKPAAAKAPEAKPADAKPAEPPK